MEKQIQPQTGSRGKEGYGTSRSVLANTRESYEISYAKLKQLHDEAYAHVSQAIHLEEANRKSEAIAKYQSGLQLINNGLFRPCIEMPEKAQVIYQKLTTARAQVMSRLNALTSQEASSRDSSPSNDRFMEVDSSPDEQLGGAASSSRTLTEPAPPTQKTSSPKKRPAPSQDIGDSIMSDNYINEMPKNPNACEVFRIPEGIQVFFIGKNGTVSAPSYTGPLKIYKFMDKKPNVENAPTAFLEVAGWAFPLLPGQSPILHSETGAYMFPDVISAQAGGYVGILLSDDVAPVVKEAFEKLLNRLSALVIEAPQSDATAIKEVKPHPPLKKIKESEDHVSDTISKGLVKGAEWIAWGLFKGAEKTSDLLDYSSLKLKEHISPEQEHVQVDYKYQTGLNIASSTSQKAVQVSGFLVDKLGDATKALGSYLAPHVKNIGESLVPESYRVASKPGGKSDVESVITVAAGGLKGIGTVYLGLEAAAKRLTKAVRNNTVDVVNHKYGPEVGRATDTALDAAINTGFTVYNVQHMGIKALATRTAKETGRTVVEDYTGENMKPSDVTSHHVAKRE
ncbi:PREDICTED: spartin-like isoform X1 [Priapulus caudatus]|uniref:Spartin-like isoform X1 n=1 Tax=Priapulus caudatus TaxID=37621 RepID=A0ABM1EUK7_PRICU|nr:PREDICTED: spartin-like isoform X1 [Priapulus caudatus]